MMLTGFIATGQAIYFGMAPAVRKNSPLREVLNQLIRKYKEVGTIEKLQAKWVTAECATSGIKKPHQVGLTLQMKPHKVGLTLPSTAMGVFYIF